MSSNRKIEANRANLQKRRGLSPEGRQDLREAALRNRPWDHSTGPRTTEGKNRSSRNALKHGWETAQRRAARREAYRLLDGIVAFRRALRAGEPDAELRRRMCDLARQAERVVAGRASTPPI